MHSSIQSRAPSYSFLEISFDIPEKSAIHSCTKDQTYRHTSFSPTSIPLICTSFAKGGSELYLRLQHLLLLLRRQHLRRRTFVLTVHSDGSSNRSHTMKDFFLLFNSNLHNAYACLTNSRKEMEVFLSLNVHLLARFAA